MKKFLVFVISISLFIPYITAEEVKEDSNNSNLLAKSAKSAILLEESTGEILYEFNSHEKLEPASMTKMMSLLLIMEAIEKGVIKLHLFKKSIFITSCIFSSKNITIINTTIRVI